MLKQQARTVAALLYAAVRHGCEAGRYDDAMTVYQDRIQRGDKQRYSLHQLGAYGSDLAAGTPGHAQSPLRIDPFS